VFGNSAWTVPRNNRNTKMRICSLNQFNSTRAAPGNVQAEGFIICKQQLLTPGFPGTAAKLPSRNPRNHVEWATRV
jgi:hypothetical protein